MLYLGNKTDIGTPVSIDATGQPVKSDKIKQLEEEVKLFDEKKLITRQSIHYSNFCLDLSTEDNPELIDFFTGIVKNGMERLAEFGVSQGNSDFLQSSVEGLATNFEEAAVSARQRIQKIAELAAAQKQQAITTDTYTQQIPPEAATNQLTQSEVESTITKALNDMQNINNLNNPYNNAAQNVNAILTDNKQAKAGVFDEIEKEKSTVDAKIDTKTDTKADIKTEIPKILQTKVPAVKTGD